MIFRLPWIILLFCLCCPIPPALAADSAPNPTPTDRRSSEFYRLLREKKGAEAEALIRRLLKEAQTPKPGERSDSYKTHDLWEKLAQSLDLQGKQEEAFTEYRAVLAAVEANKGPNSTEALEARKTLAWMMSRVNAHDQAEKESRALVEGYERELGPNHYNVVQGQMDLAQILQKAGKAKEGREVLLDAAAVVTNLGLSTNISYWYESLAGKLEAVNEWKAAAGVYRKIMSLKSERLYPVSDRATGDYTRLKLANALRLSGQYDEAAQELRVVIARMADRSIKDTTRPKDARTRVISMLYDLASSAESRAGPSFFAGVPKVKAAATATEGAAEVAKLSKEKGGEHEDTLNARRRWAVALMSTNKSSSAIPEWCETSAIEARVRGEDSPLVLHDRYYLGWSLQLARQYEDAVEVYQDLITVIERRLGPFDMSSLRCRLELAAALYRCQRYDEAEKECRYALSMTEDASYGSVRAHRLLGDILKSQKHEADSEQVLRKALAEAQKSGVKDGLLANSIRYRLEAFLLDQKRDDEVWKLDPKPALAASIEAGAGNDVAKRARDLRLRAPKLLDEKKYDEVTKLCRASMPELLLERQEFDGDIEAVVDFFLKAMDGAGKAKEAEEEMSKLIDGDAKAHGPDFQRPLRLRIALASTMMEQKNYDGAEKELRAVLAIREKVVGKDDADIGGARAKLIACLEKANKLDEAEKEYHQQIEADKKLLGATSESAQIKRGNLARFLTTHGRTDRSLKQLRDIVESSIKTNGEDTQPTQAARYDLASALMTAGKKEEALALYRAALESRKRDKGPESDFAQYGMNSLAFALKTAGKGDEALALYHELLTLRERVLGKTHQDTFDTRNEIGNALMSMMRYAEAEKELRSLWHDREEALGKRARQTLVAAENVGWALEWQGKSNEALEQYRTTYTGMESALGKLDKDTLHARGNFVGMLRTLNRKEEAAQQWRELIPLMTTVRGAEDSETLRLRAEQVSFLTTKDNAMASEKELRSIIAVQERVLGKDHRNPLWSRSCLPYALQLQGKLAEAQAECRAVLAAQEKALGENHPNTKWTRSRLAYLTRPWWKKVWSDPVRGSVIGLGLCAILFAIALGLYYRHRRIASTPPPLPFGA